MTNVALCTPSASEMEMAIHALHGILEALDWIDSVEIGVSDDRLEEGRAGLLVAGRLITAGLRRRF